MSVDDEEARNVREWQRRKALEIASNLTAHGEDARAILRLVEELIDWADQQEAGAVRRPPQLTVVPFQAPDPAA